MNDQHERNLRSEHPSVRWQALMEEHLSAVHALTSEALLPGVTAPNHGALAQAHATAALTLALANVGRDLESTLARLSRIMRIQAQTSW